ncbi:MAG: branched-chain amino acid transport system permease protein [Acidimicrobiaceae bacterium]|jgi:branched-chain amino acid transport system permease protein|nr:branched-chain amino acid transport system permease protein [Acidimicrobiaceae bacterium]MDQ1364727.1 branched-chain amino acid transport system permease protein [Acidimicrobiaceae bacterium]MDQ1369584.1 branched-chain amino acid transport system permease protein [Acidimicrobiaceae bacterium]MDQ1377571.1 branched-chain amino acid transport system permease protein [Acidimicrobiaceae bacterium]MDQ1411484.1 branched-chain amino acid transport system permease protein [Acidimicrobiaceae bacterium
MSPLAKLRGAMARARRAMPDIVGPVGRRWERLSQWQRRPFYVLALAIAVLAPANSVGRIMAPASDWKTILFNPIGVYILLALGLNVVVGLAGLLDLGYVAFFAVGAYTMATLATHRHWSFWLVLPIGIILAAFAGVILGAPTLRLRGDYLAIVTLGFGEIVRRIAINTNSLGGPRGISGIPHPPSIGHVKALTYGVLDPKPYYYLLLAMIVLVIFVGRRLERSRVGRSWQAVREDEDVAELMGVPSFKFKLWAFAIGASIGGMCGVIFASKQIAITPDNFPFLLSVLILAAVVLGGSGNIPGVILGAFLVAWLPEYLRDASFGKFVVRQVHHVLPRAGSFSDLRVLIFGGALVVMMIFRPEGLLPSRKRRAELAEGQGGMGSLGGTVVVPPPEESK